MTVEATVGAQTLDDVLSGFEPGVSFLLTAPRLAMLTTGERESVTVDNERAAGCAASLLADDRNRVVIGTVGFDDDTPTRMWVPRSTLWTSRPAPTHTAPAPPCDSEWAVRPVPEPGVFVRGVREAVDRLAADGPARVDQCVLSRGLELRTPGPLSPVTMLRHLLETDPTSHTVATALPGGRTLIGLSPDLSVTRRGRMVVVRLLSGHRSRGADPLADERLAEDLLSCEHSLSGHARVLAELTESLRPFALAVDVPSRPTVTGTAAGWRLSTELRCALREPLVSVVDLALALHPNPVACGTSARAARRVVREVETHSREYHTGAIGWCDRDGDGEWVIATRCALVETDRLCLRTTTTVVPDSSPVGELADTSADFREILLTLGVNQVP